ncbi:Uncharacterized phage-encoded protein [Edwardsiella ictaluri]|nr:Uncharacterized phage-encoded protein [Edwardsiella ictaluri]
MTHQLSVHTPSVIIRNHRPITTSTAVAEFFGKQHKNVIQKIETLDCSRPCTRFCVNAFSQK